jgi:hypothetical protein
MKHRSFRMLLRQGLAPLTAEQNEASLPRPASHPSPTPRCPQSPYGPDKANETR